MPFSITAVSSIREEWRYTSNHTCWWLQGAQGQERKRRGTGSRSAVSLAQCLGYPSEKRKESGDQNSSWPLLFPQTAHLRLATRVRRATTLSALLYGCRQRIGHRNKGYRKFHVSLDLGPCCFCPFLLLSPKDTSSMSCQPLPVTLDFSASEVSL